MAGVMSNTPLLDVQRVSYVYPRRSGSLTAVDRVDLRIEKGEIVSVVGESGSGKTTLSQLLIGLATPDRGEIQFEGKPIASGRPFWQKVQAIFQNPFSVFNHFYTVERHLLDCFNLLDNKLSFTDQMHEMTQALSAVGLDAEEILPKYPFELSGGEMQRVLIARVFIVKPTLLIADEPTSMVDAYHRRSILDLLVELNKNHNMGILFITHDIGLAQYVSDRIVVMNKGQIVEDETPELILQTPHHPYTRKLLRDIPGFKKGWLD